MKKPNPRIGTCVSDGRFKGTVSHYDNDGWMHLTNGTLISPKSISSFRTVKQ